MTKRSQHPYFFFIIIIVMTFRQSVLAIFSTCNMLQSVIVVCRPNSFEVDPSDQTYSPPPLGQDTQTPAGHSRSPFCYTDKGSRKAIRLARQGRRLRSPVCDTDTQSKRAVRLLLALRISKTNYNFAKPFTLKKVDMKCIINVFLTQNLKIGRFAIMWY